MIDIVTRPKRFELLTPDSEFGARIVPQIITANQASALGRRFIKRGTAAVALTRDSEAGAQDRPLVPKSHAASVVGSIESRIEGSSFSGLFTRENNPRHFPASAVPRVSSSQAASVRSTTRGASSVK
jgi:hypothetical protein